MALLSFIEPWEAVKAREKVSDKERMSILAHLHIQCTCQWSEMFAWRPWSNRSFTGINRGFVGGSCELLDRMSTVGVANIQPSNGSKAEHHALGEYIALQANSEV